jgi:hypothetical protein
VTVADAAQGATDVRCASALVVTRRFLQGATGLQQLRASDPEPTERAHHTDQLEEQGPHRVRISVRRTAISVRTLANSVCDRPGRVEFIGGALSERGLSVARGGEECVDHGPRSGVFPEEPVTAIEHTEARPRNAESERLAVRQGGDAVVTPCGHKRRHT